MVARSRSPLMTKLSIIIPVLNEGDALTPFLHALTPLKQWGVELIGVDGGSADNSFDVLNTHCDTCLQSPAGRSTQMNAGASHAKGDVLLFLHADTYLPQTALTDIEHALKKNNWGRFNVQFEPSNFLLNLTADLMHHRSKLTQVCTGDQALFFKRDFFNTLNGFADIPLMEDVDISKRARRLSPPYALYSKVITSSRRWQKHGTLKTILLMWWLRWLYFIGVPPHKLHKKYYG